MEPPQKPVPPMQKPMVPYLRFSKAYWDRIKSGDVQLAEGQDRSAGVMSKLIAEMWHKLDNMTKLEYQKSFHEDVQRYNKVMAEFNASKEVKEYDEKLRLWQAHVKQREADERLRREQQQLAARANTMMGNSTAAHTDYVRSYIHEVNVTKPLAPGPAYTQSVEDGKPIERLDAVINRLTEAAKFPAEQWARVDSTMDEDTSLYSAAKKRYTRNDAYMREIFCRKINVEDLDTTSAAIDPEADKKLEALLRAAIDRTRSEINELQQDRPRKRARAICTEGTVGGIDPSAPDDITSPLQSAVISVLPQVPDYL